MPMIEVAAGLVFREGKLLITRRFEDAHLGGLWEFPGGKREPRESFEECLVRELIEELDIEISVGPLVQAVTHEYPEKTVYLRFYRCRWVAREPRALSCLDFKWVTAAQLEAYPFPAADKRLIDILRQNGGMWD